MAEQIPLHWNSAAGTPIVLQSGDILAAEALGAGTADATVVLHGDGVWRAADGVPAGGTTGQVLTKQSGTDGDADWEDPAAGSGDLVGPSSSTANTVLRFSGTTGKLAQGSGVAIDDSNNISGVGDITLSGNVDVTGTVDGRDVASDGTTLDTHTAAASPHSGHATLVGGLVPMSQLATGTPDGSKFVRDDGVLATPAGSGDVSGPGTSTANRVAIFDDTSGTSIAQTVVSIDGSGNISGVGTVDGRDVSADGTALDAHTAAAAPHSGHATTAAVASAQGDATQAIADAAAAQSDIDGHVGAGGAVHTAATRTSAGFATPADRAALADALPAAQFAGRSYGTNANEDDAASYDEVIWQLTPGRWRAGVSTEGFDQPFFFAETDGTFGDGGTCALYNVIGAPTAGSASANWPASEDVNGYLVSQHWDNGIPIPPAKLFGGATLEIEATGRMLIGGTRTIYFVLDPDSDVLHRVVGNNGVALTYRDVVLGAVHGEQIGVAADLENDGDDNILVRFADWASYASAGLGTDSVVHLTNGNTTDVAESGLLPDLDADMNQPLYLVGELPLTGVAAFSGTKDLQHPSFAGLGVGDTISIDDATTSGLTTGEYLISAKVSATRVTCSTLPGNASSSPTDLACQAWGDDIFWLSSVDTGDGAWPTLIQWNASSGATATTTVASTSGTKDLTKASFAGLAVGRKIEITNAGTSGLTTGVYTISASSGTTITCSDMPANASASVSDVQVDVYDDWSYKAFLNVGVSNGSHKRMVFAFQVSTTTTDYIRFRLRIKIVADGAAQNDEVYGTTAFAELEAFQNGEAIGVGTTQTVPAVEGAPSPQWPRIAIMRTRPGNGYNATAAEATGAYLFRGKANYDGAGTTAYVPTWHDYGGFYNEVMLATDITPTGSQVMRSYTDSYGDATVTMLEVGGTLLGEVTEYIKERRIMRFRDLREDVKIKRGDTVTWKLYRKISGTWNTTPHSTGTFTAGPIRVGPRGTELGFRVAVGGAQDGSTVCEVWAAQAKLSRRRSI